MSQNVWTTIMPFGPVTNFLLAQKKNFRPAKKGWPLISSTAVIQCLLLGIWKKDNHSNEVIFQYEITSKRFHQRESFHQVRSLNTVPIVHWLTNNRNFKLFLTNTNVTSRSLNTSWSIFIEQLVNTFVKWYRKSTVTYIYCCLLHITIWHHTIPNKEFEASTKLIKH